MTSKRKWDQEGPESADAEAPSAKATKVEEGKSASGAAAAAAAIAAKIAAQFASSGGLAGGGGAKDPHDGDFVHDIDINDVRNRYLLTKGSTQQQVSHTVDRRDVRLLSTYSSIDPRRNRSLNQHKRCMVPG